MADPLIIDVLSDAAALLGDVAQEQFTNPILMPWYAFAYRELYDICQRWRLPLGQRTAFMVLPANQNVLIPSAVGFTDFGEPINLWERGNIATVAISGVSNATPVVVTTSGPHNLSGNPELELSGILGPIGVNGQWFATVTGSDTFSLNGSVAGGVYVSGGTVVSGADSFIPMQAVDSITNTPVPPLYLNIYQWQNQRLYFCGATQAIEIKVEYSASGNAPVTGTVGIDNSRSYLALRTAAFVAPQYNMVESGKQWLGEALGPSMTPDGTGGALRNLVGPMLLEKQNTMKRPGPFRPNRNGWTRTWC